MDKRKKTENALWLIYIIYKNIYKEVKNLSIPT